MGTNTRACSEIQQSGGKTVTGALLRDHNARDLGKVEFYLLVLLIILKFMFAGDSLLEN